MQTDCDLARWPDLMAAGLSRWQYPNTPTLGAHGSVAAHCHGESRSVTLH